MFRIFSIVSLIRSTTRAAPAITAAPHLFLSVNLPVGQPTRRYADPAIGEFPVDSS